MINDIIKKQEKFYKSGKTRSYEFRIKSLSRLLNSIRRNEKLLYDALGTDLNKSKGEAYISEIGIVIDEIRYHQRNLHRWMRRQHIMPSIGQLPGTCFRIPEPYGATLIMAPWNYPVNLCLVPLIGAISGGNTAVLKPSAYAQATSRAIARIIAEAFTPDYVAVVEGGRKENISILNEKFDYIFFTGSTAVGKVVMESAAKHLTPVTLELGGKSPVIVDQSARIELAARRIAFGKVTNAGQTCIAPDYLLIHSSVKERFVNEYKKALKNFNYNGDLSQMATIITQQHYERLKGLIADGRIILGGDCDDERRFIEPTLVDQVTLDSSIMKDEIFGPILPIITFDRLEECIDIIKLFPKPLALYIFSENNKNINKIFNSCSFGGGCINDTLMHFANPRMPFGGVGASGMGSYHGKRSFETFTHYRSVFKQNTRLDIPLRYMPYTDKKLRLIKKILG